MYKKPFTKAKQILEVIELAMDIQTKGYATVIFNVHGHTGNIAIAIHTPHWKPGVEPTHTFQLPINSPESFINLIKSTLQDITDLFEMEATKAIHDQYDEVTGSEKALEMEAV